MLLLGPAMAQENPYAGATQTGNLVPDFSFDGPTGQTPDGWVLQGDNQSGGAIQPGCGALSNQGKCFIFSYMGASLSTTIDLSQYNTNSFEFYFDFFYRMNCNNSIGGYCQNPDGPRDLFGASVQFFTTNGEAGSFNFIPIGPDYFKPGDPGVNEFGYKPVGWYSSQQSEFLFTSAIISFYGRDEGYWAGYYGPALDRVSFRIGYLEQPDPVIGVDCQLMPFDPSCVIDTLNLYDDGIVDYTDPNEVAALANDTTVDDTNTGSDDGSDDGTEVVEDEEEVLVSDNTEQTDIEEMLTDEDTVTDDEEETVVSETTAAVTQETGSSATYRELTDEEKAQILADSIAKNTLEMALSVAENATTSNQSTATTETTTSTNRTTIIAATESTENTIADNKNDTEQQSTDNSTDTAVDLLENGRQLNNISLAAVQSQTEQSASDSINQAESIAISSSDSKINDITIDMNISNSNDANNTSMVANDNSDIETNAEAKSVESIVEEITTNSVEQSVASIDNIDSFNDIINLEIKPVTEIKDEDLEFVQSVLAQSEQKKDDNANTFSEDEQITIQNDPNLANAFNVVPNVSNLEILGVLNNKQEEKSDAEKKAEQVVAANAKEQEEINKNYMDADQSGIVAAMGADTDVTSYRSAMLNDNNIWYKPEDIYKNVVYKDNVRGAYFLEKGNTDTYKKMVDEQYK